MTLRRWYLIMLFMPLILPALAFIFAGIWGYETVMVGMGVLLRLLIICSMIGGIPYFFFALAVLWWCRKKSAQEIKKASWWLPWIFTPVCGLFFAVAFNLEHPDGDAVEGALLMAAFCVPVGFMYVAIVHIFTRIAQSIKLIKE
jgi:hypothetical protein